MTVDDPAQGWCLLLRLPAVPLPLLRRAIGEAGELQSLLSAPVARARELGLPPDFCAALCAADRAAAAADAAWLARSKTTLLPFLSPLYPPLLSGIDDAPPALYVQGDPAVLSQSQVAVVGSRSPSAAGRRLAQRLAADLAAAGLVVTSGMARGIDTAAHQGALDAGGSTIAVCGTGLAHCYPEVNRALAARIATRGALVSELPPEEGPRAWHFPRRNRIIAALSRGTVVVEAAAGSGSLITARMSNAAGREVFAVPGSPLNPLAAGCLELLAQGAQLARGAADVLEQLGPINGNPFENQRVSHEKTSPEPSRRLDKDYEMLLDALGFEPASIDDLVERTGLAPGSVASMILILELSGRVEQRPGALYNRVD